jgi:glyoxylase-like metal-dependent hydrolase (beta-lactamase superfamily II)
MGDNLNYSQINSNLFLIDLDQKIEGFRKFISSWLYHHESITFLVDPGPRSSIESLKKILEIIGVNKLDYILLTHIHIDHAGGTGKLLKYFPEAKVFCHPKGIKHLINPAELWKGSLKVLGKIAEAYEEIIPVPEHSIFFREVIKKEENVINTIETPGHAPHHISYLFNQYLFAGEVAGVHQTLLDRIYLRPATPPKFKLETSLSSLEKVMAKNPKVICYGHYGINKEASKFLLLSQKQLTLWTEVIKEELTEGEENLEKRVFEKLMEKDTLFSNFKHLEEDIKKRERYFINNSIKGIKEYLK